jgi:hypothetical protein
MTYIDKSNGVSTLLCQGITYIAGSEGHLFPYHCRPDSGVGILGHFPGGTEADQLFTWKYVTNASYWLFEPQQDMQGAEKRN